MLNNYTKKEFKFSDEVMISFKRSYENYNMFCNKVELFINSIGFVLVFYNTEGKKYFTDSLLWGSGGDIIEEYPVEIKDDDICVDDLGSIVLDGETISTVFEEDYKRYINTYENRLNEGKDYYYKMFSPEFYNMLENSCIFSQSTWEEILRAHKVNLKLINLKNGKYLDRYQVIDTELLGMLLESHEVIGISAESAFQALIKKIKSIK